MSMQYQYITTPVGKALVCATKGSICFLGFTNLESVYKRWPKAIYEEKAFPIDPNNLHLTGTPFQMRVWKALCDIPYGSTTYYEAVAKSIGKPKAVRAVASAIASNPIALFIPCHRVISKSGKVHKYAYGTKIKEELLRLEALLSLSKSRSLPQPSIILGAEAVCLGQLGLGAGGSVLTSVGTVSVWVVCFASRLTILPSAALSM